MSVYTTEVRFICEQVLQNYQSVGDTQMEDVITGAEPIIFDFTYPIINDDYAHILNRKILRHYYYREIGYETYGLWKSRLRERMLLIMPYYKKVLEALQMEYDPFQDVDYYRDYEGNIIDNGSLIGNVVKTDNSQSNTAGGTTNHQTVHTDADSFVKHLDTPQGGLNGFNNNEYLTYVSEQSDTQDVETNGETTDDHTTTNTGNTQTDTDNQTQDTRNDVHSEHVHGKMSHKSYMELLQEYFDVLRNVDEEIINKLSDLFMCIW